MDKPMGCFLLQQAHYTHIIYRLLTAEVVKSKVRYLAYAFIQGNLHRHPAVARNQTWVNHSEGGKLTTIPPTPQIISRQLGIGVGEEKAHSPGG